jgi:hydrogenase maturation protease
VDVLVIGYGNDLRGDDGAGPRVAAEVAARGWPSVEVLAVHQLTPELAEALSRAGRAVFVDAAVDGLEVSVRPLGPAPTRSGMGHSGDPGGLLELARTAFGRCPPAWLVTVPGDRFGFGFELSALARRGVAAAVAEVQRLARERPAGA